MDTKIRASMLERLSYEAADLAKRLSSGGATLTPDDRVLIVMAAVPAATEVFRNLVSDLMFGRDDRTSSHLATLEDMLS